MERGNRQKRDPARFTPAVKAGARAPRLRGSELSLLSSAAAWVLCLALATSAPAAPPQTRTVTTGALQMTGMGLGSTEVRLTSDALQMTGLGGGAATVALTTGPILMTGLGSGSAEVRLSTGALQMTGLGATGTGIRVTTGELRMTGFGL